LFAWILVVSGLVAAGYGYTAFIGRHYLWQVDKNELSALGNFLQGAVASLWSLAAFVFIYVAFLGQQEELHRHEAMSAQERFESIFFELVRIHHSLVAEMQIVNPQNLGVIRGRSCFHFVYETLRQIYDAQEIEETERGMRPHRSTESMLTSLDVTYKRLYQSYQEELGHLFRNLYHVVLFVDSAQVPVAEQKRYMKMLRAQLSSRELLVLFYNCLSELGNQKFKPLIEKYAFLEQLPTRELLRPEHEDLFLITAYVDAPGNALYEVKRIENHKT
jgi:hypothetical protein